jgi:hypothetical protein
LSDSNGLRRHFRVADSRTVRRARPESAVDFALLHFGPRRGGKTGKSEAFFRRAKRTVSRAGRKSLRSLGAKSGNFQQLFVFNGLTPFSFRPNRKRHPGHMKRRAGLAVSSEKQ